MSFFVPGHTTRLPIKLESRSPSMLLVSWAGAGAGLATGGSCALTLYGAELDSYNMVGKDSTFRDHYRFTALDSCSPHVACVETAGTHTFTCLSAITGKDWRLEVQASAKKTYRSYVWLTGEDTQHMVLVPLVQSDWIFVICLRFLPLSLYTVCGAQSLKN